MMRCKWIWLLVGCLMVLGVASCRQAVSSFLSRAAPTALPDTPVAETVASTATAEPAGTPTPLRTAIPTIPIPSDTTLQKLVMRAKEDLAKRLSIEMDQIGLVEAKAVEWSDTSLGCPKPGMMYAQVITPGYRVVLEVKGETYEYHTDQGRVVVLCESTSSPGMPSKEGDTTVEDG